MRGNSGTQYKSNFRVIGKGNGYAWQNTATGFVSNVTYQTYEDAEAAIKKIGELPVKAAEADGFAKQAEGAGLGQSL